MGLPETLGLQAQRRDQAVVVQGGRAQLGHQVTEPTDLRGQAALQQLDRLTLGQVRFTAFQAAADQTQLHAERRQLLDRPVVQVGGDPGALLLGGGDQPAQQQLPLLTRLVVQDGRGEHVRNHPRTWLAGSVAAGRPESPAGALEPAGTPRRAAT